MRAKDEDSSVLLRRESANIHEIGIECYDRAAFHQTRRSNAWVRDSGQPLFIHSKGIVAALNEKVGKIAWQVFVGLEPHHPASGSVTTRPDARSEA